MERISRLDALKLALLYMHLYAMEKGDMSVIKKLGDEDYCQRLLKIKVEKLEENYSWYRGGNGERQCGIDGILENIEEILR